MEYTLEFEKPIVELRNQLKSLHELADTNGIDLSQQIMDLEDNIAAKSREIFENLSPWQRISLARHPGRPYAMDYIQAICTDFMELKGDRLYGNDDAIVAGFARIDGRKILVIGHQKGRDVKERNKRNFGMAHPEGYRKALRLMRLADKAGLPILTFIDTPGAYPGIASEERHVGEAIAVNLREMFNLKVPVIATVIGEGGSGGALGIGVANRVLILENSYYSVISPEGCASIVWKDGSRAAEAAEALKLAAQDLHALRIVDEIVAEPFGGAHRDPATTAASLKACLLRHIDELSPLSQSQLQEQRYQRFRHLGSFAE